MIKQFLMVVTVAALTACQTTSEKISAIADRGEVFVDTYSAANGRVAVPLPSGEWIVAGADVSKASYANQIEETMLVNVVGGQVNGYVEIRTPLSASTNGWVKSSLCDRSDIHHVFKLSNTAGGVQDCWGINHYRMTIAGKVPAYIEQTRDYIVSHKINSPLNAIAVEYRFADKPYFVDVKYFFNPEVDGFTPPKIAEWATSDWHRDRVYMDPAKVAYIDKIKTWGREWYPKVKAGFEGNLPSHTAEMN